MKYTAKVRYSELGNVEPFVTEDEKLSTGTFCVIHTDRGMEIGRVVSPPVPLNDQEQYDETKFILRPVNEEDQDKMEGLLKQERKEYLFAKEKINQRNMKMKLSKVSHLFGGEKIIFYFLADGRVDFRALVRDLAKQYKTRIEMRQVGVRDEARIIGDVSHCGQKLCCTVFIKNFKPITMKMAKNQKASLDPKKISGLCGKLLCCLRYEDKQYVKALAKLPQVGAVINTKQGQGEVISVDAMKESLYIIVKNKGRVQVTREEVLAQLAPPPPETNKSRKRKKK